MHRSREAGRFHMDNHSSRPGERCRYATPTRPLFCNDLDSPPAIDIVAEYAINVTKI